MAKRIDCSELSRTLHDLALNVGSREHVSTFADLTREMQAVLGEDMIDADRLAASIVEATTGAAQEQSELQSKLNRLKREARQFHNRTEPQLREKFARQIDELKGKLRSPAVAPVRRESVTLSKALERQAFERDLLRRKIHQRIQDLKPLTIMQKVMEPIHFQRAAFFGMDFGQVLQHGKMVLVSHPLLSIKNLPQMFKSFASEGAAHKADKAIEDHPLAPLAYRAKLSLSTDYGSNVSKEEYFQGHFAHRMPGIKHFARAFRVFLNAVRFQSFVTAVNSWTIGGEATDAEARIIANFINVTTGRGAIPDKIVSAVNASSVLVNAARYQTSRAQFIIGQPLWGVFGSHRGSAKARAWVAKEYARTIIGWALYQGMLYSAFYLWWEQSGEDEEKKPKIEANPLSSDFGKIRIGNTRIDTTAGIGPWITFMSRSVRGMTKQRDGDIVPIRGKDVPYGGHAWDYFAFNFARNRMAPAPGAIVDGLRGTTPDGQEATLMRLLQQNFVPLGPRSVYDAMREEGLDKGSVLGAMAMFGEGVSVWEDREQQGKPRRKPARPKRPERPSPG